MNNNKPKIYEELEEALGKKVNKAGDFIEWLQFPNGQIFSESDPAIRGTVIEAARGNDTDGYGAMIAPRHALAINNPGGIDLLTRNPDGSFGAQGWMFRDGRFGWHGKNVVRSINGALADDAGNVQLIEFHSDVNVWWKQYSNGWIEQGGLIYASGGDYDIVTFPIPFASIPARGDFQMGIRGGAYPTGFYRMTTFADSMTRTTMNVFAKNGSNEIQSVTGFWSAYGF